MSSDLCASRSTRQGTYTRLFISAPLHFRFSATTRLSVALQVCLYDLLPFLAFDPLRLCVLMLFCFCIHTPLCVTISFFESIRLRVLRLLLSTLFYFCVFAPLRLRARIDTPIRVSVSLRTCASVSFCLHLSVPPSLRACSVYTGMRFCVPSYWCVVFFMPSRLCASGQTPLLALAPSRLNAALSLSFFLSFYVLHAIGSP